jgi:signal transduction histidine kinase
MTTSEPPGRSARAETMATRSDGTRFPVGYTISRLVDLDGTALGTLVLFQDLSEIARLRDVAARQERLLVLGRLSAGLAHEIRNPLSSISGSVQLVRESPHLDDEERRLLGIILDEVERLDELVSTMLQVGRPLAPRMREVDLRNVVDAVVEVALRGTAAAQGIRIDRDVPDAPVLAWVDSDQVRQVVWNLVKNAVQASPWGALVRVSAKRVADGRAQLEVADQGRGIDSAQRQKIYDMFYSERTHGAGIGLALVRQIVDAHGGTIEILSEQNQGATFIVTFRAHAPAEDAA